MRYLLTISLTLAMHLALAQHPNAHAHNDYEHDEPLIQALKHGFTSIEADVHLVNNKLWVSHNRPTASSQTLETLYLQPLASHINEHGGIYAGYYGDFFLMIDIKTEADRTYAAIESLLQDYLHIIDTPLSEGDNDHPLKVFLSGNRPIKTILNSNNPAVALDGRPNELNADISAELMPVVSSHFRKYNPFTASGDIDPDKELKLKAYIDEVHDQGRKVRFWAHPDNTKTWDYLLSVGVDLINSDKLQELDNFLSQKGN